VPAAGLPKITSVVSRNCSPAWAASALWSITANSRMPFAAIMLVKREIVSFTGRGLSLVMMPDWPAESSSVMVISYLLSWPDLATANPSPA
jgi:hypothetical protein